MPLAPTGPPSPRNHGSPAAFGPALFPRHLGPAPSCPAVAEPGAGEPPPRGRGVCPWQAPGHQEAPWLWRPRSTIRESAQSWQPGPHLRQGLAGVMTTPATRWQQSVSGNQALFPSEEFPGASAGTLGASTPQAQRRVVGVEVYSLVSWSSGACVSPANTFLEPTGPPRGLEGMAG